MNFKDLIKKLSTSKKPLLAVLIDPDKYNPELISLANKSKVACFLVGGSDLKKGDITQTIFSIKKISKIPVILFPGNEAQLSKSADGLLLLSLLSGNNPDYLITKHVTAAPIIKKMKLAYLPTAYLLIDGGARSTTQKVTNTLPMDPKNKRLIINTALASEQLGFKAVYLEAGSGAKKNVAASLIKDVKNEIKLPVIVGGGLDSVKKVKEVINSGANMVVIGNALEKNVFLLSDISACF
jgi:putative glycerol-1-phosphate prenyltransferase